MKSYKNYTKQASAVAGNQAGRDTASAEELTKKIAAAYDGKSNMAMFKSILAEAERSKRAGTLSNAELDSFYQSFSPMLNGFQRRQLKEVVERLKNL